ncbi:hypothetical protein P7C71_g6387, partial [Lecanoromycetidae sp. Uapishka_2]
MAPPSATMTETHTNGDYKPSTLAPHEPGLSETKAKVQMPKYPGPPTFKDKHEEREYLKGRLAAAFRIFGKYGFDEGVAGHITLRDPVDPTTFWVNPFGVAFSLMKRSDLIQVDHNGTVIEGGPLMADAAAGGRGHKTVKIDDEDAAFTYKTIGTPMAGWFSAKPMFDVIEKECGEDYMR